MGFRVGDQSCAVDAVVVCSMVLSGMIGTGGGGDKSLPPTGLYTGAAATIGSEPVGGTSYQPFKAVANRIEDIGDQRERLRILIVIFLGVLLIGVVVLRVRNCGQPNQQRGAENNCN